MQVNWNKVGVWTSLACAVHCAITPLALVLAPLAGFAVFDHWVEISMVSVSFVIASYSNISGHLKFHKSYWPIMLMVVGFLLIGIAHLMHFGSHGHAHHGGHSHHFLEILMSVSGALMIAASLIYNQKLTKSCTCDLEVA